MPKEVKPRIILTGGGTGGHRYPLAAVWQEIKRLSPQAEARYVGSRADATLMSEILPTVAVHSISTGKLRRYLSWDNLHDLGRVLRGYREAMKIVREYRPHVVFAKGGYVSVPLALAATRQGVPVITHESDAVLGLANRLVGRRARQICTSFDPSVYPAEWQEKMLYTGPIIRQELVRSARRRTPDLKAWRGEPLPKDQPVILVLGGSQGALRLNQLLFAALPSLLRLCTVIHQTGPAHYEAAVTERQRLAPAQRDGYRVFDYLSVEEMGFCLKRADAAISRAGSSIFELALFGLPTLLVPLSTSAGGHQAKNAAYFVERQAALVLDEQAADGRQLSQLVRQLLHLSHAPDWAANIKQLSHPNGAEQVARQVITYV